MTSTLAIELILCQALQFLALALVGISIVAALTCEVKETIADFQTESRKSMLRSWQRGKVTKKGETKNDNPRD